MTEEELRETLRRIRAGSIDAEQDIWDAWKASTFTPAQPTPDNLSAALGDIPPDLNWLIGKGKTRPDEPPFGVQLLRGLKVVAETEGDDLCEVIRAAIAIVETPK